MKKIVLILLLTATLNEAKLAMPNELETCSRSDPNLNQCFVEKANLAFKPFLANGDPRYNIEPLKPYIWNDFSVDIKISSFKFTLDNITVSGLENSKIDKANIDFDKKSIRFLYLNPKIRWNGKYTADFKETGVHKTFDGPAELFLKNGTFNMTFKYELNTIDGEEYANIIKYYVEFTDVPLDFKIPALDAEPLVHDLWEKVKKNFVDEKIERGCGRDVAIYFNKIFNVVPWNEVFTP